MYTKRVKEIDMSVMEKQVPGTPTLDLIVAAAQALSRVCDGAHAQDGMGYNGADSATVKSILRFRTPSARQIWALWQILRKYKKQLLGHGFVYEELVPPTVEDRARRGSAAPFIPQPLRVSFSWVDTQYGRRIAVVTSEYSADVVAKLKKQEKRWFDKEGKNSSSLRNAWLIPDDAHALDLLLAHLSEIKPAVQIEQAQDLKTAMDQARTELKAAYQASRAESAELEIKTKLPLRPFQRAGVKWALDLDGRALIADEPGLGKTAQALGFLMAKSDSLPALVVCPATLRGTWVHEIRKFTDYRVQVLTAKSSLKMLRKADFDAHTAPQQGYDITVMNYDMFSAETAKTWIKMAHGSEEEAKYAREQLVQCGIPALKVILEAMAKKPGLEIMNRLNLAAELIKALGDKARGLKEKRYFRSFVNGIPMEDFMKAGFKTLISDEAHYIKESKSQRGMATKVVSEQVRYSLALTGTPVLNNPKELWNIVDCVNPKIFPSFFNYAKRYCNGHQTRFGWDFSGSSNLEELDQKLRTSVMIRRMKEQVVTELPPKIRITVPMALDKLGDYEDETKDPIKKLALLKKQREEWKEVLATLSEEERQKYISEHAQQAAKARKLTGQILDGIEKIKQAAVKAKFDECVEYILGLQKAQGKVIVFMVHHEFTDRMVAAMKDAGLKTGMIDGRVPMGERDAIKNAFQEGDTDILVCGIRAASEGLTLTASHTVVFMELDWNPSRHYQAEDRVHRIGQKIQPTMYYLVGIGTIEEEIAGMIDGKREVVNAALGEGDRTVDEDGILDAIVEGLLK